MPIIETQQISIINFTHIFFFKKIKNYNFIRFKISVIDWYSQIYLKNILFNLLSVNQIKSFQNEVNCIDTVTMALYP